MNIIQTYKYVDTVIMNNEKNCTISNAFLLIESKKKTLEIFRFFEREIPKAARIQKSMVGIGTTVRFGKKEYLLLFE